VLLVVPEHILRLMQDRLHRILQAVEIGLGEMTRKMKMRYPNQPLTLWETDCEARIKKSLGEKTVELMGSLVSGVKDWFSSSKTPRREYVQSVVPRKTTPQRSLTSRMEEGFDHDEQSTSQQYQYESGNMFSPSLAPHYAGHTPYFNPPLGP